MVLQSLFFSNHTLDHLIIPFVYDYEDNLYKTGNWPSTPQVCNLNKRPLCQNLSKAFGMSRNTPLTSTVGLLSNALYISCITESSCAVHESLGRKLDCEEVKSLLLWKTLLKMGSKLMGR